MTEQNAAPPPTEAPVDPLFTHPASPFLRTEPGAVAFPGPPEPATAPMAIIPSAWSTHKAQIQFGLTFLAYLMVVIGSVTVVNANHTAPWRLYVAMLPVIPAALVLWLFVRALSRLDEVAKRVQLQAFGFALAGTALLTFGYGFLEQAGMPDLNWTFVLPVIALLWALGFAIVQVRQRYRR